MTITFQFLISQFLLSVSNFILAAVSSIMRGTQTCYSTAVQQEGNRDMPGFGSKPEWKHKGEVIYILGEFFPAIYEGEKNTEEKFDKQIVKERIARLSAGIAIIQVGAQTVVELKDKKLKIEDALNAARAAIEEGVVVGGGCCLLRLSMKVDSIKELMDNEEHKVGADIFKRALSYPCKLIAKNAGMNGNVVVEKVLSSNDIRYGYNAAKNCYEDLMASGILDPSKVVRCCIEHAASVAKIFLTADVVVVDAMENLPVLARTPMRKSNFIPASREIKF